MWTRAAATGLATVALGACAPQAVEPALAGVGPAPDRPLCGWEELEPDAPHLRLTVEGQSVEAAPGSRVVVLLADDEVTYSAVETALAPAAASLVRVKLAVGDRWLLPLTHQQPRLAPSTPPEQTTVSVVGHQRVTRRKGTAAIRLADLRLDGERVTLFVENEVPGGIELPVSELSARLEQQQPPVQVFTLHATGTTTWRDYVATVRAAACHGLGPGDEPHEVIVAPKRQSAEATR